jgi:hypothetical protein
MNLAARSILLRGTSKQSCDHTQANGEVRAAADEHREKGTGSGTLIPNAIVGSCECWRQLHDLRQENTQ